NTAPGQGTVVVGGLGGAFQLINANVAAKNGCYWYQLGSMPNVLVTQLQYVRQNSNSTGDFVLAATFGRGAWELRSASTNVGQPGTLQVSTAGFQTSSNLVQVRLDPNNTGSRNYLQVLINGNVEYDGPLSFDALRIQATNPSDTIELD